MMSPIKTTLIPIVPMRTRRNRGRDSSPNRTIHFRSQRFTTDPLVNDTAGTRNVTLFPEKTGQLLLEMRRNVRRDQRVFAFILHLKNMADAMKFGDQI